MKWLLFLIPPVYAAGLIIFPVYFFKLNYFWSAVLLFWVPSALLYLASFSYLRARPNYHKAFWVTFAVMIPVTTGFEYVALALDIWNFSEQVDKLLGWRWFGVPVEEFVFWYGCAPFCVLLYVYYKRLMEKPDAVQPNSASSGV